LKIETGGIKKRLEKKKPVTKKGPAFSRREEIHY